MDFRRITRRDELIQYIVANKSKSARLRDLTDEEVVDWAKDRDDEFIQTIASGIWKDSIKLYF